MSDPPVATTPTLRDLRHALGLTQLELARRVGLTDCHVSHFEHGRALADPAVVRTLAAALNVSPAALLDAQAASRRATATAARPAYVVRGPERCGDCGRLAAAQRVGARILSPPAYCGRCARPLTAEAMAAVPLDGFVAMARVVAREPAHPARRPATLEDGA